MVNWGIHESHLGTWYTQHDTWGEEQTWQMVYILPTARSLDHLRSCNLQNVNRLQRVEHNDGELSLIQPIPARLLCPVGCAEETLLMPKHSGCTNS